MKPADVIKLIKDKEVKYADLRFTDTRGKEQHVTIPAKLVDEDLFRDGKMFDGSSIAGWKGINESDMILMLDPTTAVIDPFFEETTVNIRCDVIEPATMQGYERDPRSLGKRAEAYLKSTGIADGALFGPENEFFIFDSVRWTAQHERQRRTQIDSVQGAWNSNKEYADGNKGHRPGLKGGYFPVPPVDAFQDIRSAMCDALEEMGLKVEVHHHEVATGGQCEIGVGRRRPREEGRRSADPQVRDPQRRAQLRQDGHLHAEAARRRQRLAACTCTSRCRRTGKALFAGDKYGGLSDTALYYIGGIIKHAKAHQRVHEPGHEQLQASRARLRSARDARVLRAQSFGVDPHSVGVEPEGAPHRSALPGLGANPYFAFAAMMMAGLDGIQNKIHPGEPADKDLYDLEPEEAKHIPHGVPLARHGARAPRQGPRVPDARRRVHQRRDRCLHRTEDAGSHAVPHVDASGRDRHVLQLLRRREAHGSLGCSRRGEAFTDVCARAHPGLAIRRCGGVLGAPPLDSADCVLAAFRRRGYAPVP